MVDVGLDKDRIRRYPLAHLPEAEQEQFEEEFFRGDVEQVRASKRI